MKRRDVLRSLAGGLAGSILGAPGVSPGETPTKGTRLGIVVYCLGIRQRARRSRGQAEDLSDPLNFLEHCRDLGAGGIQIPLGTKEDAYALRLRKEAEDSGMFIEAIMGLPRDRADVERFEAEIRTAKRAGANVVRVVIIPGRRYERFGSAEEFRQYAERGVKSLELAEPVAARHGVRLAVENHKDQRVPERLEVLRRISSEYVGTCVDTGNSFVLLEDPVEAVKAYAPWALTVHLKDQAVAEYEDGFLFADAALGDGFLDLKQMVQILREANPTIRFSLETITRDPLEVPCLTEKYWATAADVSGRDLARTLGMVRASASDDLPQVSRLPLDEQVQLEEANVRRSLAYARDHLEI